MTVNMDSLNIRARANECLDQFKFLSQIEQDVRDPDKAVNERYDATRVEDQLARFKMWAGNIGVFAEGHASLDHRLRESEETKQVMVEFLLTLKDFICAATDALKPGSVPGTSDDWTSSSIDVEETASDAFELSASSAISSSFQGTETDSIQDEMMPPTNPFENKVQGVERTIDRLYRLSVIIRQPSMASQNDKAQNFAIVDEEGNNIDEHYTKFAQDIIHHKYPNASKAIQTKLANGIVTRRRRFLYRQRHQQKLTAGAASHDELDTQKPESTIRHNDVVSTIRAPSVIEREPTAGTTNQNFQSQPRPAPSQTSASAIPTQPLAIADALEDEEDRQSTAFTGTLTLRNLQEVPPPPKPVSGSKEFECPYCCLVLPIKQAKASRWRRHVLDDLEPYTCVFEGCSEDGALFRDRASWIAHMQAHKTRWVCTSSTHQSCSFACEDDYVRHMWTSHEGVFTNSQLPFLVKRSKVAALVTFRRCPLCFDVPSEDELKPIPNVGKEQMEMLASERITKHLAVHMEALAVMSLPWRDLADVSEGASETRRADDVTVESEGSSQKIEPSSSSLQFSEDGVDEEILELPPSGDRITPPADTSYEQDWGFIERRPYFGHARDETLQPLLRRLFLETTSPSEASGPILPAFLVPLYRDKKFFGRHYVLNAIEKALCLRGAVDSGINKPLNFPRCFAVYGPGGMGKTQIASEFAEQHREEFDAILWVHAEDSSKVAQGYREIAVGLGLISSDSVDAMDLGYTRDIVKRWLVNPRKDESTNGVSSPDRASWLLVFDGVEDGEVLNEFWPYNGPGSILVTSRNPHSWSTSLELKPFNVQEATDYLFWITQKESLPEERRAAVDVANRLGGLPLALSQMAGIIVHQQLSFTQFLRLYEKQEGPREFLDRRVADMGPSLSNYEYNVASVWAFDRLAHGVGLINALSMLDSDGIPEGLFTGPVKDQDTEPVRRLKEEYNAARTELIARSLITWNKREKKIFVHRLVQEVARARMRQSETRANFLTCVSLVCGTWPFEQLTWRHGIARWADCEELFPHVQKLKALFPSIAPSPDTFDDYWFARLLVDAGWYIHERGMSTNSVLFNNMAQSICESLKLRILEHPELASTSSVKLAQLDYTLVEITHNRGCIALEINEPADALKYLTQFNDTLVKEETDPDDMRLGISWNELGNARMLNGQWKRGEGCYLKSIHEMRKYKRFRPTTISLPLANLGLAYWLQGKNEMAASTLLQGLRDREVEYGQDDRVSFITGRFLHALGNVKSSMDYHHRALMHYRSTLGNRHHRTADLLVKVAEHNILIRQYEVALALLDHAFEAFSTSSRYIPERTRAGWMRHKALKGLGKREEAESELANCFQVYLRLREEREARGPEIKRMASELDDGDIDDLIVFWSK